MEWVVKWRRGFRLQRVKWACLSSSRWYFALISVSGVFAVTFSVIFAYVADVTEEHERSTAYGVVRWVTQDVTSLSCVTVERRLWTMETTQMKVMELPRCTQSTRTLFLGVSWHYVVNRGHGRDRKYRTNGLFEERSAQFHNPQTFSERRDQRARCCTNICSKAPNTDDFTYWFSWIHSDSSCERWFIYDTTELMD